MRKLKKRHEIREISCRFLLCRGVYFSMKKSTKSQKEEGIPLLNTFCRLAATRANILPRQSDHRRNRKYGSDPRLTRTFVHSDFSLSRPNSMSIKPCSIWWSLAYSGEYSFRFGVAPPTPSNLLAFCGRCVRTRGMADDMMRDILKIFALLYIAHTCRALLSAADSTGCEVVCKGGRGAFL